MFHYLVMDVQVIDTPAEQGRARADKVSKGGEHVGLEPVRHRVPACNHDAPDSGDAAPGGPVGCERPHAGYTLFAIY
ncbi:MAG: hypothetical protein MPK62_00730 [Alphaproteobacteria bacterium]|nr:hypothetical protein [Alphaproteobacteria bacterium]